MEYDWEQATDEQREAEMLRWGEAWDIAKEEFLTC
jgi:hypothetical protein